ncbi:winged helix-turn-helix domain-containing protein [Dyella amyloliquefaciens]|uniref:winged helix-turn-helix domain-containing protein n=1 Tax=Dyella amyloliquefaciens TaxID=1770545 RepID=UPI0013EEAA82|nr:winged helix-turn-helix domain-containing protein [Dyella amyloliquefaciens]
MAHSQPGIDWIYQFDDIVVEPRAHRLVRAGVSLSVEPKAFSVLLALLQQAGEVVGKEALLDAAWGHRHVTPGVLTRVISQLRHTLGDCAGNPRYIATVHTLGYRFIGDVHRTPESPVVPAASEPDAPRDSPLPPSDSTAKPPDRPTSAPMPWLAAVIMVAAIVAMLAAASLWHPPRDQVRAPRTSPQPAFVVLPFIHASTHAPRPRHWPRTRRIATLYPSHQDETSPHPGGAGYLHTLPERAPAARE